MGETGREGERERGKEEERERKKKRRGVKRGNSLTNSNSRSPGVIQKFGTCHILSVYLCSQKKHVGETEYQRNKQNLLCFPAL